MTLTSAHRHILRHTLGLNRSAEPYRNRYIVGDEHDNMPLLLELVAAGYMVERRLPTWCGDGVRLFVATEAGRQAVSP